jgi:hypothetical protein
MAKPQRGEVYRQHDRSGKLCKVLHIATHTEDGEQLVVYHEFSDDDDYCPARDPSAVSACPLSDFTCEVKPGVRRFVKADVTLRCVMCASSDNGLAAIPEQTLLVDEYNLKLQDPALLQLAVSACGVVPKEARARRSVDCQAPNVTHRSLIFGGSGGNAEDTTVVEVDDATFDRFVKGLATSVVSKRRQRFHLATLNSERKVFAEVDFFPEHPAFWPAGLLEVVYPASDLTREEVFDALHELTHLGCQIYEDGDEEFTFASLACPCPAVAQESAPTLVAAQPTSVPAAQTPTSSLNV